jgi:hypothetical protein
MKKGKKVEECALKRNKKFMYINVMRPQRSRQAYNGFITTFILLGLLEEAYQRNMRWYLLTTCKFSSKMKY